MKKVCVALICLFMLWPIPVYGEESLAKNAGSAIIIEASSNQVLFSKNENEKLYPASTTKIMTLILLFEAINNQQIAWEDVVTVSQFAQSMGGSQVYLETGEQISVYDLCKSIAISSANDASVAIGEYISGNNSAFVEKMNQKASELQLQNTHFVNPTGLHDENHYTSAYDLALMASYLIKIGGEKLLEITSMYDSYIREDSNQKFWLVNTNKLLNVYPGVDGLKTGFTSEAGYCLVTTVEKDGMRVIAVVMNESDPTTRNQEMIEMLDYAYANFEKRKLFSAMETIDVLKINTNDIEDIDIISKEDIYVVENKANQDTIVHKVTYQTKVPPFTTIDTIATLEVIVNDESIKTYPLYSKQEVKEDTFFWILYKTIKRLL